MEIARTFRQRSHDGVISRVHLIRCGRIAYFCAHGLGAFPIDVDDDDAGSELGQCVTHLPAHPLASTEHQVSALREIEALAKVDNPVAFGRDRR